MEWLGRRFGGRRGVWGAALLGMVLTLPSLGAGWLVDDHWHRLALTDREEAFAVGVLKSGNVWDLFSFLDGDPGRNANLRALGVAPWWTYDGMKGAFCRPVTAATHVLDYRLFPNSAWVMHLHSVLWYGALIVVLGAFYRRVEGVGAVSGLAVLLYAVADVHAMPVGFLANRNAVMAALFGLLAMLMHDRWRRDGWSAGAVLGPALFLVALLAKEAAAAFAGYLVAYAIFLDRAGWRRGLISLLPYGVCLAVWRLAWSSMGYGIMPHVDLYIDPAVEPLRYAFNVLVRLPILLMGQLGVSADSAFAAQSIGDDTVHALAAAGVVVVGVVIWAVRRRVRFDATARFWVVGTLLAGLPACTAFPADRMLMFVGIGGMGLLARVLLGVGARLQVMNPARELPSPTLRFAKDGAPGGDAAPAREGAPVRIGAHGTRLASVVVALLIVRHLFIAPAALAVRASMPAGPAWLLDALAGANVDLPEDVADRTVVMVNAPVAMFAGQLPAIRASAGLAAPKYMRVLSASGVGVTVSRVDERTLLVRPNGGYLRWFMDGLFRDRGHPFELGEVVELPDATITVAELNAEGRPAAAAFRFDEPLPSDALYWLRWSNEQRSFVPFEPPGVGEEIQLPAFSIW